MNITPPDCYVLTKFIGQAATKKWSAAGPTFCETTITTSWVMAEIVAVLWQSCCVSIFVSSNAIDVWVALLQNWDHHLHCDYSFFSSILLQGMDLCLNKFLIWLVHGRAMILHGNRCRFLYAHSGLYFDELWYLDLWHARFG
jgi:hypothetical protein